MKMAWSTRVVGTLARCIARKGFIHGEVSSCWRTPAWTHVGQSKPVPLAFTLRCLTMSPASNLPRNINNSHTIEETGGKAFSTSQAVEYAEDDECSDIMDMINERVSSRDVGRLFAVVYVTGVQRKVTEEDILVVEANYEADIGERICLNKVLLVGGKDFTLVGRPLLRQDQVRVEATVIEKSLANTKIIFKYWRRKGSRIFKLFKSPVTFLRINSIELAPVCK